MAIQVAKTRVEARKSDEQMELQVKAKILDEVVELIEDTYLGSLMRLSEKEQSIPLKKARQLLR